MFETYSSNRKVPTGIPIIDHLLDGGLERGSSVLVKAHPLADPSAMIIQLLHQRLESGDIGLYFVNNKTPESVIEESTNSGMNLDDFKRQNQLVFIDSFSALFGLRSKEIYAIDNIEDAASISKVVSSALSECSKKGKVFLIFDALNTSLDEVGESILSEIGNWSRIAVAYDAILCFLYTEWNYSTSVSEAVAHLFPTIIDLMSLERIVGTNVVTVSKTNGNLVKKKIIPIKRSVTGGIKGYIPKILVTRPFHAGKTTIVHTLSDRATSVQRLGTTVALDFGHVDFRGFALDLFGSVGQPRFDPILEHLGGEALGAILVVDSTKPEDFPRAKEMMFKSKVLGLPYVVAANKQDVPGALSVEEIRKRMNMTDDIAIIPTVGNDRASVMKALDVLIDKILLI